MLFSLEALEAGEGDCMLLYYGDAGAPRLVLVDGGPPGTYKRSLRPRLSALLEAGEPERGALPIDLTLVSHIDGDHIAGILDLTDELVEADQDRVRPLFELGVLWHNSFDDLLPDDAAPAISAAVVAATRASAEPQHRFSSVPAALVVASVPQGRRNAAESPCHLRGPVGSLPQRGSVVAGRLARRLQDRLLP